MFALKKFKQLIDQFGKLFYYDGNLNSLQWYTKFQYDLFIFNSVTNEKFYDVGKNKYLYIEPTI